MSDVSTQFDEALGYLYSLQKYGIKFGLSKTSNLLQGLGNPETHGRFVHIGGTNGKGSVAAFLSSILQESGYRVGLYTSPHLVSFTERMQINGRPVSKAEVVDLTSRLRQVIAPEEPPTFFEAVTAMALDYFRRQNTDLTIVEVGLGGRLDATNVITPLLSIITNISMEHQEFLGRTLAEVASEKAGIIKPNVPLLTGARQTAVRGLFESICRERKAPFYRLGRDYTFRTTWQGLQVKGPDFHLRNLELSLAGRHQGRNAALALAAADLLTGRGFPSRTDDRRNGLKGTVWPGRMHILSRRPIILLDGGHNPAALKALADSVQNGLQYRRLILVLGIMADKDAGSILKNILPLADQVICTRPEYDRALDPGILAEGASRWTGNVQAIAPLEAALSRARQLASPEDCIVVTGSLFTVGEALSILDPVTYPPERVA
jgi:dihydrofolate synthase/folylpolyglutamate synthase